jgi:Rho family, other
VEKYQGEFRLGRIGSRHNLTTKLILGFAQQVDSRDSLENVASKWVAEITEHCQGVKVVLVALKCDLREEHEKEDDGPEDATDAPTKQVIQYQEGLDVARKIGALRYLGRWMASKHTFRLIKELQGISTNILGS